LLNLEGEAADPRDAVAGASRLDEIDREHIAQESKTWTSGPNHWRRAFSIASSMIARSFPDGPEAVM